MPTELTDERLAELRQKHEVSGLYDFERQELFDEITRLKMENRRLVNEMRLLQSISDPDVLKDLVKRLNDPERIEVQGIEWENDRLREGK